MSSRGSKKARRRPSAEAWTPFLECEVVGPSKAGMGPGARLWKNSRYQVVQTESGIVGGDGFGVTHLSIKRLDRQPIHDWRDLQRVKNELCGREREGVELYPCESRTVDTSNQYHVWVLPLGRLLPFGFFDGRLVSDVVGEYGKGAVQRPFEEQPEGLVTIPDDEKGRLALAAEARAKFKAARAEVARQLAETSSWPRPEDLRELSDAWDIPAEVDQAMSYAARRIEALEARLEELERGSRELRDAHVVPEG